MVDIASIIKERIKMSDILLKYNFEPNRSGFIYCPFHNEKTPSLKIYKHDRGWYCFGCGKGGSVIDFVMNLFRLNLGQAISKIDSDFCLGLCTKPMTLRNRAKVYQRQDTIEDEKEEQNELEYQYNLLYNAVTGEFRKLRQAKPPSNQKEKPSRLFIQALQKLDYLEWWLDNNNTFDKWRKNYYG